MERTTYREKDWTHLYRNTASDISVTVMFTRCRCITRDGWNRGLPHHIPTSSDKVHSMDKISCAVNMFLMGYLWIKEREQERRGGGGKRDECLISTCQVFYIFIRRRYTTASSNGDSPASHTSNMERPSHSNLRLGLVCLPEDSLLVCPAGLLI